MYVHEISVSCIIPNVPKVSYRIKPRAVFQPPYPISIVSLFIRWRNSNSYIDVGYQLSVQLSPYSDAPPLSERFVWNHIMAIFPSL